jgi:hypothetical protein
MRVAFAVRQGLSGWWLTMLLVSAEGPVLRGADPAPPSPISRWEEGQPGCTFSRDDDGKYRYGLWSADVGIVLAVDSQELEKARRRAQPIFGVLLTVHYRGNHSLDVSSRKITLEFVKHDHDVHDHDVHVAFDPDDLLRKQRHDAATLGEETEREIRKHPEKKEEKTTWLAARQKDAAEMVDFLNTRSLRTASLDPGHAEISGWVLFSSQSRGIDEFEKQEEFVLRVPLEDRVMEFPFSLPTRGGDLILRRRTEN